MHIYVAGINEKLQTALPTERAIYKSNKISADKPLKSYFGSTGENGEISRNTRNRCFSPTMLFDDNP